MSIISTERLILKPLETENLKDAIALDTNSKVMKYISNGKPRTLEYISNWLDRMIKHHDAHGYGLMATYLKNSNKFIGWAGIKDLDGTEKIELGYRLLDNHWGKGYATEASKALIDFARHTLGLDHLSAITVPENEGSIHVIEKCRFIYKGMAYYYNTNVLYFELNLIKNKS